MNTCRRCTSSVCSERKNLRRAGTLKNRWRTSTDVPGGQPTSRTSWILPAAMRISVPVRSAARRVQSRNRATEVIAAKASPRNPRVAIRSRSFTSRILLVACRSTARSASSRVMPRPLSSTPTSVRPPHTMITSIWVASASSAFSTSSLSTEAGRSTTSPAAILFATTSDST